MEIYDTQDIARLTSRSIRAVSRLARTHGLGTRKGNGWVFGPEDLAVFQKIDKRGGGWRPRKKTPTQ
jgi:hypothetical protein